jgi:ATP adenylyltransferase
MPFPDDLVDRGVENDTTIPFQHYVSRLSGQQTPASLYRVYTRLLGDMQKGNFDGKLSYNFNMTREWMFLSPRKKDDYINQEYRIGVNSTGMIGLLLTKSPEESQFLEDIGPVTVLEDVGISWSAKRET